MNDSGKRDAFTLKRWSKRKLDAARAAEAPKPSVSVPSTAEPVATTAPAAAAVAPPPAVPELPAIDSLTIDSDFTAFLRPGVDETLRRGALRKLFSDPRFNVMDRLDVYIDDYSKPELLPAAVARTLAHARYIFDPPVTRVNAEGFVEDVPPEETAPSAPDPAPRAGESNAPDAPRAEDDGEQRSR